MWVCFLLTVGPGEVCRGNDPFGYDPRNTADVLRFSAILQVNDPAERKNTAGNLRVSAGRQYHQNDQVSKFTYRRNVRCSSR